MAKAIQVPLDFLQQASATAPAAGRMRLYAKTDASLYAKKPDGTEVALGAGGAAAAPTFVSLAKWGTD